MTDHYAVVNPEDLEPVAKAGPPFACELCDRTFQTSTALGVHFRTHGSQKKPCPDCGVEYFPGPGMERHRQAKHGANKLNGEVPKKGGGGVKLPSPKKICPECHRPISSKDLARHRRTQHGYVQTPAPVLTAVSDDALTEDDVFNAVVGLLFPRGVIPITALTPLLRWRHATGVLLEEVTRG